MKLSKLVVVSAVAASLLVAGFVGPVGAHTRTITQVHTNADEYGILASAWLEPEQHAGVMKIALKRRNAAGDWVLVARKAAEYRLGWGYTTTFDPVPGDRRCKAFAVFTSNNHPTLRRSSPGFAC